MSNRVGNFFYSNRYEFKLRIFLDGVCIYRKISTDSVYLYKKVFIVFNIRNLASLKI